MDIITTDINTLTYIQSDREFELARRWGFWKAAWRWLIGQPTRLRSLNDVADTNHVPCTLDLGEQDVPLSRIIGSVDRSQDYTATFAPRSYDRQQNQRWRDIYRLVTLGRGFPPIELFKVGDDYFVQDGHHRVSVAAHLGWKTIQAKVTELFVRQAEREVIMVQTQQPVRLLRLMLYKNEVCRLPESGQRIRVLSGKAWISLTGRDVVLNQDDTMTMPADSMAALVSALGDKPLVLELMGDHPIDHHAGVTALKPALKLT